MTAKLPELLLDKYMELKPVINSRLKEYTQVAEKDYFYELCYCLMTPQTKAESAFKVQIKLTAANLYNQPFNPSEILGDKAHYIRFHNAKSLAILQARDRFNDVLSILKSKNEAKAKRQWLDQTIKGIGMKESSHFLRNIGYRGLAILDRHILKHLVGCGVFNENPNISTESRYLEVENKFQEFADSVRITMDELDLLFWSYETGRILK
ncbi:MAG: N-glycosylase/DNA lyase [Bacteroidota bacterium]|nr:N-glycosylase/DNA lyase [Bacteroidota bacterium]